ncbi:hypothetical protein AAMO2058_001318500 [Amorphochlora amoebiformis]
MSGPTVVASVSFEEIEGSKENIQPLRKGRNPKKLVRALKLREDPKRAKFLLHQERIRLEKAIHEYHGEDPLAPWIDYIEWAQEAFPSGGEQAKLVEVLEACTRTLSKDEKYRQDKRYLRVWLTYADSCKEPIDLFNFMEANNIGTQHSLFYEAWALVLESRDQIALANEKLSLGFYRNAKPTERLKERLARFQKRAAKRITEALAQEEEIESGIANGYSPNPNLSARRPLQGLLENDRRGLRNRRGVLESNHTSRSRPVTSRGMTARQPAKSSATNFHIFQDDASTAMASSADKKGSAWSVLPTQKSMNKENSRVASTWTEGGIEGKRQKKKKKKKPSLRDMVGSRRRGRHRVSHSSRRHQQVREDEESKTAEKQPIKIFVDPECVNQKPKPVGIRKAVDGKTSKTTLACRQKVTVAASLVNNPLRNFETTNETKRENSRMALARVID